MKTSQKNKGRKTEEMRLKHEDRNPIRSNRCHEKQAAERRHHGNCIEYRDVIGITEYFEMISIRGKSTYPFENAMQDISEVVEIL